jgi:hypothetical protein
LRLRRIDERKVTNAGRNKKGQPGAPEAVLEPSRLEGQLDEFEGTANMLRDGDEAMNTWLIHRGVGFSELN